MLGGKERKKERKIEGRKGVRTKRGRNLGEKEGKKKKSIVKVSSSLSS